LAAQTNQLLVHVSKIKARATIELLLLLLLPQ
jgi:hypothetical protein